jgi:hypothetical protein
MCFRELILGRTRRDDFRDDQVVELTEHCDNIFARNGGHDLILLVDEFNR